MTALDARSAGSSAGPSAGRPAGPLRRACDVLASEWIKLRSVRSTYLALLIAVVSDLALSAILAAVRSSPPPHGQPPRDPMLPTLIGMPYAALSCGVLGVLAFSAEHATGLIRTTFAAVPRRRAVLTAKVVVTGLLALIVGELLAFASFFLVQAILSRHHLGTSLAHPGVLRAVLSEGTLLCLCVLLGVGLGAIIRYTAGAVAGLIGLIAIQIVLMFVPAPWNDRIGKFTLVYSASQVVATRPNASLFSPAMSMLVLLAWPAAVLLAAAVVIRRQDT